MKKYMLSLVALVVAVAAMAFTNVETTDEVAEETRVAVQYLFTGSQLQDATDPDLWVVATGSQNCPSGEDLPCTVITDMDIEDWLDGRDAARVLKDANTRKN